MSKKNLNILEFPSTTLEAARQIEAILFAIEERPNSGKRSTKTSFNPFFDLR